MALATMTNADDLARNRRFGSGTESPDSRSSAVSWGAIAAGTTVGSATTSAGAAQGSEGGPMGYFIDLLFRRDAAAAVAPNDGAAAPSAGTNAGATDSGWDAAEMGASS